MGPPRDAASLIWPGRPGWPAYPAQQDPAAGEGQRCAVDAVITVYAANRPVRAWRLKRLLRRKGHAFEVVDVTDDDGLRARLAEATGRDKAPLIFVDGRLVGGFEVVKALDRSGHLDRLLRGEV